MKIDPNMVIGTPGLAGMKPQVRPRGDFDVILKGVEQEHGTQAARTQGLSLSPGVNPVTFNALSASSEALDLLERYGRSLENPSCTLRDLEPMVEEMAEMRERLAGCASSLSEDDPLRLIVAEVSGTLSGEMARFRRGDLTG